MISTEADVFNRYYHKPLPGESVKTYSAAEIYHRLKQSMHNVSVQRPAQTLSVIGIERIHTHYGSLYRVVSHPSQEFTEYYLYSGVCEPLFGI